MFYNIYTLQEGREPGRVILGFARRGHLAWGLPGGDHGGQVPGRDHCIAVIRFPGPRDSIRKPLPYA